jgi:hypothetical protein
MGGLLAKADGESETAKNTIGANACAAGSHSGISGICDAACRATLLELADARVELLRLARQRLEALDFLGAGARVGNPFLQRGLDARDLTTLCFAQARRCSRSRRGAAGR